jgi:hypothetical protein
VADLAEHIANLAELAHKIQEVAVVAVDLDIEMPTPLLRQLVTVLRAAQVL